ncbi:ferredoxin [Mycobacterium sp. SMC-2]|uniref:ferredoxin n=1 Tax=Mycobacterium sp. SMC-2 TaxID=2857058 RepID=UPI0021B1A394|nr:ferredoxin [Mycobacterium sp. SMC-2]
MDRVKCKGYELCIGEAPEVFDVDEAGKAFVVDAYVERVPAEQAGAVREAEFVCPEHAILVEATKPTDEQGVSGSAAAELA